MAGYAGGGVPVENDPKQSFVKLRRSQVADRQHSPENFQSEGQSGEFRVVGRAAGFYNLQRLNRYLGERFVTARFGWAIASAMLIGSFGSAYAADMAVKARPMLPEPIWTWTGFYVGVNAGYDWGRTDVSYIPPGGPDGFIPIDVLVYGAGASQRFNTSGFTGGGQAGYNYQVNRVVFGVEGDLDFLSRRGGFIGTVPVPPAVWGVQNVNLSGQDGWLATIRGRLGFTFNRVLFYATGGVAFTDAGVNIGNNWNPALGFRDASVSITSTRTGWVAGGGVEYALQNNWSIKAEYLRLHFDGSATVSTLGMLNTAVNVFHNYNVDFVDNIVRVGVNYRFGGPIVARY